MILMDPSFWLWAPLVLAGILLMTALVVPVRKGVLFLGGLALLLLLVGLVATAGWSWLFRDGLGPDSVASGGSVAWARFTASFTPPLIILSVAAFIIGWACRRKLRRLGRTAASAT